MVITIILLLILLACVGALYPEGMWGNALRLLNVLLAGVLATTLFEPLADWIEGYMPSYTYVWDFIALWGLFVIFVAGFRVVTDKLSQVKVRFPNIVDRIGSVVFAALIGWAMMCFTLMSLHTAPLGKTFFFGSFQAGEPMLLGISPDKCWLSFVQSLSRGPLCRSSGDVFDPGREFIQKYADRRLAGENHVNRTSTIRRGPEEGPDWRRDLPAQAAPPPEVAPIPAPNPAPVPEPVPGQAPAPKR